MRNALLVTIPRTFPEGWSNRVPIISAAIVAAVPLCFGQHFTTSHRAGRCHLGRRFFQMQPAVLTAWRMRHTYSTTWVVVSMIGLLELFSEYLHPKFGA